MVKKKEMEETVDLGFEIDDSMENEPYVEVPKQIVEEVPEVSSRRARRADKELTNVLRNEKIIVRFIPKQRGIVTDPKHVLYGGMAETAVRIFTVPRLRSGALVNVLTDAEKEYLEDAMGVEVGYLNSTRKKDNYWEDFMVRLTKQDNYLDLSDVNDYIKYKVLLANKDYIAPSLRDLQDCPKETYQFVIISEGEETKQARDNMSVTMKCYKEFGKVENDSDVLRLIVETLEGRPLDRNTKLEFLQAKINEIIQANAKSFLSVITDEYLQMKVLIRRSVDNGIISNRDGHYYLIEGNVPLCGANEEATLSTAAKYLSSAKHQDLLFAIQAKLKD